uniref:Uncharacterized protein n=1 Tax=Physcomitrium patens TaxID=3218 RepID=A0A2K1J4J1_PHYPA|nr:hypothetical protein PHYPA_022294 [Physcomitrium patens]
MTNSMKCCQEEPKAPQKHLNLQKFSALQNHYIQGKHSLYSAHSISKSRGKTH